MGTFGVQYAQPLALAEWELVEVWKDMFERTLFEDSDKKRQIALCLEGHLSEYSRQKDFNKFSVFTFKIVCVYPSWRGIYR